MTQQTCDFCGTAIEKESIDVMISTTTYDADHEVSGTMEPAPKECGQDYLVFCTDCKVVIVNEWNNLLDNLMSRNPEHSIGDRS